MDNITEDALDQFELIDKNRRGWDGITYELKERMKENIKTTCEKINE